MTWHHHQPTSKPGLSLFPTTGSEFTELVVLSCGTLKLSETLATAPARVPRYYYYWCSRTLFATVAKVKITRAIRIDDLIRMSCPSMYSTWHPFETNNSSACGVEGALGPFSPCQFFGLYVSCASALVADIPPNQAELQQHEYTGVLGNSSRFSVFFLLCWHEKVMTIIMEFDSFCPLAT